MKDNFSDHPEGYFNFRPGYPEELFQHILSITNSRIRAWDCGTGNGQIAAELAQYFETVYATDISAAQLEKAIQKPNILYTQQSAEHSNFPDAFFDLIVVAQAVHWFQFDQFYAEVKRCLKTDGILLITGYGLIQVNEKIDKIVGDFYTNIVGPYWDEERKYIDQMYQSIPFPFIELPVQSFFNKLNWSFGHLIGYLNTWSAVHHFTKDMGYNPLDNIYTALSEAWGIEEFREVRFPILYRAGKTLVI